MRDVCSNVAGGRQHTGVLDLPDRNCSASGHRRSLARYVRLDSVARPRIGETGTATTDSCQATVTEGLGGCGDTLVQQETSRMRELRDLDLTSPRDLTRRQRLLVVYAVGLVSVVLAYTLAYAYGMRTLENRPRTVFRAFNFVIETMTTTGYGADSPWDTPVMNVVVATMQVTGVFIGFVTLRVLVIPLFERTPLNLDDRLSIKSDHVVVAEYQRDTEVLLDELERFRRRLRPRRVRRGGCKAALGRRLPGHQRRPRGQGGPRPGLHREGVAAHHRRRREHGQRRADGARSQRELARAQLYGVDASQGRPRRIGVDRSVAPHALIGRRLAEKATTPVTVDTASDGDHVAIREVLVRRGSPLHGVQVGNSPLANHPDLTLVAGWFDGELRLSPDPVTGSRPIRCWSSPGRNTPSTNQQSEVSGVQTPRTSAHTEVIIAGYGEGAAPRSMPCPRTSTSRLSTTARRRTRTSSATSRSRRRSQPPVLRTPPPWSSPSTATRRRC